MVHLTENELISIQESAKSFSKFPQRHTDHTSRLTHEEKANRYQQLVCDELSKRLGQDVNEFVTSIPGLIDDALAARDFEKVKQLTLLKSQIFDLMF